MKALRLKLCHHPYLFTHVILSEAKDPTTAARITNASGSSPDDDSFPTRSAQPQKQNEPPPDDDGSPRIVAIARITATKLIRALRLAINLRRR